MKTDNMDITIDDIINTVKSYNPQANFDLITKAYNLAYEAHADQKRISGEMYITHPLHVAMILTDLHIDEVTIAAALLHDVVEDTIYTIEQMKELFGEEVAMLIDGVTKLSKMKYKSKEDQQLETYRKMFLAMAKDIRVIMIKLADRLHNMRTLKYMREEKQKRIAKETLEVYAPLANRLGISNIKWELEDLCLRYLEPETYYDLVDKVNQKREERQGFINDAVAKIQQEFDKIHLKGEIKGRAKHFYSIYRKMKKSNKDISDIFDLLAVRVLVQTIPDCYTVLGIIHAMWKPLPGRFKDYIAVPKTNGYQSLHTTVITDNGLPLEIQIRTFAMHAISEYGIAAHWKYKEGGGSEDEGELSKWLKTIKEILDDPQPDAMDFLDAIKLNLYASEIFVFTPKGEIKTMPAGCTALDFAFQIHTFLGSHCIGAKVNHKLVPLSHKLQSGDQVEILTSKSQHVQEEWVNFVSSAKAKSKILAILRRDSREVQKKGENILTEWLKKNSIEMSASVVDRLCDFHNIQKPETLFQSLGDHQIILGDKDFDELQGKPKKQQTSSWRNYIPFLGKSKEKAQEKGIVKPQDLFVVGKDFNKKKPLILTEENINQFIFPSCCHAIPGDDVMGFIDNKNRIEIHKRSCSIAAKLKSSFGNRIVDAKWDMHKQILFDATIEIKGIDRKGMLLDVSKVISDQLGINIHKVTISSDNGIFDGTIELRVHDREEVKTIMNQLRNIDDLQEVQRIL